MSDSAAFFAPLLSEIAGGGGGGASASGAPASTRARLIFAMARIDAFERRMAARVHQPVSAPRAAKGAGAGGGARQLPLAGIPAAWLSNAPRGAAAPAAGLAAPPCTLSRRPVAIAPPPLKPFCFETLARLSDALPGAAGGA
jgi:hypothetical protein